MLDGEVANFVIGGSSGGIRVKPQSGRTPRVFVYRSNFNNVFAADGSAISTFEVGKLYVHTCNFNQTVYF
jgi:hypothetical protein